MGPVAPVGGLFVAPEYFRAAFSMAWFAAALLALKQPLKLPAPASAPASTCSCRWRLCSNQWPASITKVTSAMPELIQTATITSTAPRSACISLLITPWTDTRALRCCSPDRNL